jgi:hypothetical protein
MHDRVIARVDDNTNIVGVNFKDEAAQKTSSADATSVPALCIARKPSPPGGNAATAVSTLASARAAARRARDLSA